MRRFYHKEQSRKEKEALVQTEINQFAKVAVFSKYKFSKVKGSQLVVCKFCHLAFQQKQVLQELTACAHFFHQECLREAVKAKLGLCFDCPVCNQEVAQLPAFKEYSDNIDGDYRKQQFSLALRESSISSQSSEIKRARKERIETLQLEKLENERLFERLKVIHAQSEQVHIHLGEYLGLDKRFRSSEAKQMVDENEKDSSSVLHISNNLSQKARELQRSRELRENRHKMNVEVRIEEESGAEEGQEEEQEEEKRQTTVNQILRRFSSLKDSKNS
jgi:hypothetical protein